MQDLQLEKKRGDSTVLLVANVIGKIINAQWHDLCDDYLEVIPFLLVYNYLDFTVY